MDLYCQRCGEPYDYFHVHDEMALLSSLHSGHLSRRTGAGAGLQVNLEVLLGEMSLVGAAWYLGYQSTLGLSEGLAGSAITVGSISNGFFHF